MSDIRLRNVTRDSGDVVLDGREIGRVHTTPKKNGNATCWAAFDRAGKVLEDNCWSRDRAIDAVVAHHNSKARAA